MKAWKICCVRATLAALKSHKQLYYSSRIFILQQRLEAPANSRAVQNQAVCQPRYKCTLTHSPFSNELGILTATSHIYHRIKDLFSSQMLLWDREVSDPCSSHTAAKTLDSSDRKLVQQNSRWDLWEGKLVFIYKISKLILHTHTLTDFILYINMYCFEEESCFNNYWKWTLFTTYAKIFMYFKLTYY